MRPLTSAQSKQLLNVLQHRFEASLLRHPNIQWDTVVHRLNASPEKLLTLFRMEETGGEPDVVILDPKSKDITFVDCASESPSGRRSLCYDHEALTARKANKPKSSAIKMANEMGIQILKEQEYYQLQLLGNFDTKTSSWIFTPSSIRSLGGALFADRRYDKVFTYHNGAESYYAARGFRGLLKV